MHHLAIGNGWYANFNGDFSGNVHLLGPGGREHIIPYYVMQSVVAEQIRRAAKTGRIDAHLHPLFGGNYREER